MSDSLVLMFFQLKVLERMNETEAEQKWVAFAILTHTHSHDNVIYPVLVLEEIKNDVLG